LALKAKEVENQSKFEGRRLDLTEAQNLALNKLEADKLSSDNDYRTKQLNISRDELDLRANQVKEDQRLRGVEITNEQAYRKAEVDIRTSQIKNEYERSGQQITVDEARIKAQQDIAKSDNDAQMARLDKQTKEQGRQFDLENKLREAFGMSEATGYVYDPKTGQRTTQETVQGQVARNQTLLSLAQALGGLSQEQIAKLFGGGTPAPTPSPSPTSGPGNPTPTPTTPRITGETTTSSPPGTTNKPFSNWTPAADERGYLTRASIAGTPLESVWDNPQVGVRYRIGGYGVWHDGTGWKFVPVVD
jgi:hypothetical protein